MRQRVFTDLFLRYGSGSHYVQRFAEVKHWNWIAWMLIIAGSLGWIAFLLWNP